MARRQKRRNARPSKLIAQAQQLVGVRPFWKEPAFLIMLALVISLFASFSWLALSPSPQATVYKVADGSTAVFSFVTDIPKNVASWLERAVATGAAGKFSSAKPVPKGLQQALKRAGKGPAGSGGRSGFAPFGGMPQFPSGMPQFSNGMPRFPQFPRGPAAIGGGGGPTPLANCPTGPNDPRLKSGFGRGNVCYNNCKMPVLSCEKWEICRWPRNGEPKCSCSNSGKNTLKCFDEHTISNLCDEQKKPCPENKHCTGPEGHPKCVWDYTCGERTKGLNCGKPPDFSRYMYGGADIPGQRVPCPPKEKCVGSAKHAHCVDCGHKCVKKNEQEFVVHACDPRDFKLCPKSDTCENTGGGCNAKCVCKPENKNKEWCSDDRATPVAHSDPHSIFIIDNCMPPNLKRTCPKRNGVQLVCDSRDKGKKSCKCPYKYSKEKFRCDVGIPSPGILNRCNEVIEDCTKTHNKNWECSTKDTGKPHCICTPEKTDDGSSKHFCSSDKRTVVDSCGKTIKVCGSLEECRTTGEITAGGIALKSGPVDCFCKRTLEKKFHCVNLQVKDGCEALRHTCEESSQECSFDKCQQAQRPQDCCQEKEEEEEEETPPPPKTPAGVPGETSPPSEHPAEEPGGEMFTPHSFDTGLPPGSCTEEEKSRCKPLPCSVEFSNHVRKTHCGITQCVDGRVCIVENDKNDQCVKRIDDCHTPFEERYCKNINNNVAQCKKTYCGDKIVQKRNGWHHTEDCDPPGPLSIPCVAKPGTPDYRKVSQAYGKYGGPFAGTDGEVKCTEYCRFDLSNCFKWIVKDGKTIKEYGKKPPPPEGYTEPLDYERPPETHGETPKPKCLPPCKNGKVCEQRAIGTPLMVQAVCVCPNKNKGITLCGPDITKLYADCGDRVDKDCNEGGKKHMECKGGKCVCDEYNAQKRKCSSDYKKILNGCDEVVTSCIGTAICSVWSGEPKCSTCRNGVKDSDEDCEYGYEYGPILSPSESCKTAKDKDGNLLKAPDGNPWEKGSVVCKSNCIWDTSGCSRCGDGITQLREDCDDGNKNEADACSNKCTWTYCGDGIIQSPNGMGSKEKCEKKNGIWETRKCTYNGEEDLGIQQCRAGACLWSICSCTGETGRADACETPGFECGIGMDGCGNAYSCGKCDKEKKPNVECVDNKCKCSPDSDSDACYNLECGKNVNDGCGGTVNCGSCDKKPPAGAWKCSDDTGGTCICDIKPTDKTHCSGMDRVLNKCDTLIKVCSGLTPYCIRATGDCGSCKSGEHFNGGLGTCECVQDSGKSCPEGINCINGKCQSVCRDNIWSADEECDESVVQYLPCDDPFVGFDRGGGGGPIAAVVAPLAKPLGLFSAFGDAFNAVAEFFGITAGGAVAVPDDYARCVNCHWDTSACVIPVSLPPPECAVTGNNCASLPCGGQGEDNCGNTVTCPNTCSGNQVCYNNACCTKYDQSEACSNNEWGSANDNCGGTVRCGSCPSSRPEKAYVSGTRRCCQTKAKVCGSRQCGSLKDNCGRTHKCGSYGGGCKPGTGKTCSNGQCICPSTVTATCKTGDSHHTYRCGDVYKTCTSEEKCENGECVCASESDSSFCSRQGKKCGSVSGVDNCGFSRTVKSCGTCGSEVCNAQGQCVSGLGTCVPGHALQATGKICCSPTGLLKDASYYPLQSDDCREKGGITFPTVITPQTCQFGYECKMLTGGCPGHWTCQKTTLIVLCGEGYTRVTTELGDVCVYVGDSIGSGTDGSTGFGGGYGGYYPGPGGASGSYDTGGSGGSYIGGAAFGTQRTGASSVADLAKYYQVDLGGLAKSGTGFLPADQAVAMPKRLVMPITKLRLGTTRVTEHGTVMCVNDIPAAAKLEPGVISMITPGAFTITPGGAVVCGELKPSQATAATSQAGLFPDMTMIGRAAATSEEAPQESYTADEAQEQMETSFGSLAPTTTWTFTWTNPETQQEEEYNQETYQIEPYEPDEPIPSYDPQMGMIIYLTDPSTKKSCYDVLWEGVMPWIYITNPSLWSYSWPSFTSEVASTDRNVWDLPEGVPDGIRACWNSVSKQWEQTYCGDGAVQKPNDKNEQEECDPGNAQNSPVIPETCQQLLGNKYKGVLGCNSDCRYDTSGCTEVKAPPSPPGVPPPEEPDCTEPKERCTGEQLVDANFNPLGVWNGDVQYQYDDARCPPEIKESCGGHGCVHTGVATAECCSQEIGEWQYDADDASRRFRSGMCGRSEEQFCLSGQVWNTDTGECETAPEIPTAAPLPPSPPASPPSTPPLTVPTEEATYCGDGEIQRPNDEKPPIMEECEVRDGKLVFRSPWTGEEIDAESVCYELNIGEVDYAPQGPAGCTSRCRINAQCCDMSDITVGDKEARKAADCDRLPSTVPPSERPTAPEEEEYKTPEGVKIKVTPEPGTTVETDGPTITVTGIPDNRAQRMSEVLNFKRDFGLAIRGWLFIKRLAAWQKTTDKRSDITKAKKEALAKLKQEKNGLKKKIRATKRGTDAYKDLKKRMKDIANRENLLKNERKDLESAAKRLKKGVDTFGRGVNAPTLKKQLEEWRTVAENYGKGEGEGRPTVEQKKAWDGIPGQINEFIKTTRVYTGVGQSDAGLDSYIREKGGVLKATIVQGDRTIEVRHVPGKDVTIGGTRVTTGTSEKSPPDITIRIRVPGKKKLDYKVGDAISVDRKPDDGKDDYKKSNEFSKRVEVAITKTSGCAYTVELNVKLYEILEKLPGIAKWIAGKAVKKQISDHPVKIILKVRQCGNDDTSMSLEVQFPDYEGFPASAVSEGMKRQLADELKKHASSIMKFFDDLPGLPKEDLAYLKKVLEDTVKRLAKSDIYRLETINSIVLEMRDISGSLIFGIPDRVGTTLTVHGATYSGAEDSESVSSTSSEAYPPEADKAPVSPQEKAQRDRAETNVLLLWKKGWLSWFPRASTLLLKLRTAFDAFKALTDLGYSLHDAKAYLSGEKELPSDLPPKAKTAPATPEGTTQTGPGEIATLPAKTCEKNAAELDFPTILCGNDKLDSKWPYCEACDTGRDPDTHELGTTAVECTVMKEGKALKGIKRCPTCQGWTECIAEEGYSPERDCGNGIVEHEESCDWKQTVHLPCFVNDDHAMPGSRYCQKTGNPCHWSENCIPDTAQLRHQKEFLAEYHKAGARIDFVDKNGNHRTLVPDYSMSKKEGSRVWWDIETDKLIREDAFIHSIDEDLIRLYRSRGAPERYVASPKPEFTLERAKQNIAVAVLKATALSRYTKKGFTAGDVVNVKIDGQEQRARIIKVDNGRIDLDLIDPKTGYGDGKKDHEIIGDDAIVSDGVYRPVTYKPGETTILNLNGHDIHVKISRIENGNVYYRVAKDPWKFLSGNSVTYDEKEESLNLDSKPRLDAAYLKQRRSALSRTIYNAAGLLAEVEKQYASEKDPARKAALAKLAALANIYRFQLHRLHPDYVAFTRFSRTKHPSFINRYPGTSPQRAIDWYDNFKSAYGSEKALVQRAALVISNILIRAKRFDDALKYLQEAQDANTGSGESGGLSSGAKRTIDIIRGLKALGQAQWFAVMKHALWMRKKRPRTFASGEIPEVYTKIGGDKESGELMWKRAMGALDSLAPWNVLRDIDYAREKESIDHELKIKLQAFRLAKRLLRDKKAKDINEAVKLIRAALAPSKFSTEKIGTGYITRDGTAGDAARIKTGENTGWLDLKQNHHDPIKIGDIPAVARARNKLVEGDKPLAQYRIKKVAGRLYIQFRADPSEPATGAYALDDFNTAARQELTEGQKEKLKATSEDAYFLGYTAEHANALRDDPVVKFGIKTTGKKVGDPSIGKDRLAMADEQRAKGNYYAAAIFAKKLGTVAPEMKTEADKLYQGIMKYDVTLDSDNLMDIGASFLNPFVWVTFGAAAKTAGEFLQATRIGRSLMILSQQLADLPGGILAGEASTAAEGLAARALRVTRTFAGKAVSFGLKADLVMSAPGPIQPFVAALVGGPTSGRVTRANIGILRKAFADAELKVSDKFHESYDITASGKKVVNIAPVYTYKGEIHLEYLKNFGDFSEIGKNTIKYTNKYGHTAYFVKEGANPEALDGAFRRVSDIKQRVNAAVDSLTDAEKKAGRGASAEQVIDAIEPPVHDWPMLDRYVDAKVKDAELRFAIKGRIEEARNKYWEDLSKGKTESEAIQAMSDMIPLRLNGKKEEIIGIITEQARDIQKVNTVEGLNHYVDRHAKKLSKGITDQDGIKAVADRIKRRISSAEEGYIQAREAGKTRDAAVEEGGIGHVVRDFGIRKKLSDILTGKDFREGFKFQEYPDGILHVAPGNDIVPYVKKGEAVILRTPRKAHGEIIVLDFKKDTALRNEYLDVKLKVQAVIARGIKQGHSRQEILKNALDAVYDQIYRQVPTSRLAHKIIGREGDAKMFLVGSCFDHGGVCRHQGAIAAGFTAKLVADGVLSQDLKVVFNRGFGHAWAEVHVPNAPVPGFTMRYVMDVTQGKNDFLLNLESDGAGNYFGGGGPKGPGTHEYTYRAEAPWERKMPAIPRGEPDMALGQGTVLSEIVTRQSIFDRYAAEIDATEQAKNRYDTIRGLLEKKRDVEMLKMLDDLQTGIDHYIMRIVSYENTINRAFRKYGYDDPSAIRAEQGPVDEARRAAHDAAISTLQIFTRRLQEKYGWKTMGGEVPEGGIYSFKKKIPFMQKFESMDSHTRDTITDWMVTFAKAMAESE